MGLLELLLLHEGGQLLLRQHDGDGGGLLAVMGLLTLIWTNKRSLVRVCARERGKGVAAGKKPFWFSKQ